MGEIFLHQFSLNRLYSPMYTRSHWVTQKCSVASVLQNLILNTLYLASLLDARVVIEVMREKMSHLPFKNG